MLALVRLAGVTTRALALSVTAALAADLNVFSPPETAVLRILIAVPLLLAPGYALTAALFPRGTLSGSERLCLVGGMSLAVIILLGLALDAVPGGLHRASWSLGLAAVAVAASAAGALSRGAATLHETGLLQSDHRPRVPVVLTIGGLAGIAVMIAALGAARDSALQHDRETRFTELWALPANPRGDAAKYGVTNDEGRSATYRVVARLSSGRVVFRSGLFQLRAGASRIGRIEIGSPARGAVQIALFLAGGGAHPYRSTRLELHESGAR